MSASRLRVEMFDGRELQVDLPDRNDFEAAVRLLHDWRYGNPRGLASIETNSGTVEIYLADIKYVTFES